jgi:hypothetical protein
MGLFN